VKNVQKLIRRQPAVRFAPDEIEYLRTKHPEPERDRVARLRFDGGSLGPEVLSRVGEAGGVPVAVVAQGWLGESARLWGAAEGLCAALGAPLPPDERAFVARAATTVRAEIGEEAFTLAWAEGRAMTPEQALAALERTIILSSHPPVQATRGARRARQQLPSPSSPNDLTEREMEVLRLVARGLTDAQVADALVISPRTVNAHLRSIYSKLGITSRHAATLFAIKQQLI